MAKNLIAVGLLGLFVRMWRGYSMLDPFFFIPFACLSVILVGPLVLKENAIWKPVLLSCASACSILLVALTALNLPWQGAWLLPEWTVAVDALLLSGASATAVAVATRLFVNSMSKWVFRGIMLAGLIAWRFTPIPWSNSMVEHVMDWGLSTTALSAAAALVMLDAGLIYILSRRHIAVC